MLKRADINGKGMINKAKVAGMVSAILVVKALLNAELAPLSSSLAIRRDNSGSNTIPIANSYYTQR